eukprot:gene30919-38212_t
MIRNGKRVLEGDIITASISEVYMFKLLHHIQFRKPQDLTMARLKAAEYKWNADATTVVVSRDRTHALVCVVHVKGDPEPALNCSRVPNEMNLLVKWFHMCSAAGYSSDLVLIVALPNLPEGEFYAQKVKGLSSASDHKAVGWLYACSSRNGNGAMWVHWFLNVVIPCLKESAEFHEHKDVDGKPSRTFFSTDGEACILNEVFNKEVLEGFAEARVDYMKGGPSATSKHQPCDVSSNFRDFKTGMSMVGNNGVDTANPTLDSNIANYLSALQAKFPSVAISADFKPKLAKACEKIVYVLRNKYYTSEKSIRGFVNTGQHIRDAKQGQLTVSYHGVMGQSLHECSDDELKHMEAMVDTVVVEARRAGRITNAFLDDLKIVTTDGAIDRDELTLCRQDAQIVTHDDSIARHAERMAALATREDPVEQERIAEETAAVKFITAHNKKELRKLETQARRDAENARKDALTPLQRKEENLEKKRQKLVKDEAKRLEEAEKLANALRVVDSR